jgi:hypothetical protein
MKLLILIFSLIYLSEGLVPLLRVPGVPVNPDSYFVCFKDVPLFLVDELLSLILVKSNFPEILPKCWICNLPQLLLSTLLLRSDVIAYIEADHMVEHTTCTTESSIWNLARVSGSNYNEPYTYTFNVTAGSGVTAYIIDSGIKLDHIEFGGRARFGYNAVGDGNINDCIGHGTHVAGTVGSASYGVAKQVELVAVKVFGCGSSTATSIIINGMNWVKQDCTPGKRCTANMSLGGPKSKTLDSAAVSLSKTVFLAVAAGNDNAMSCNFSPARASSGSAVTTVGATSYKLDSRAYYSNFGNCVTLYAPGTNILSTWHTDSYATNTISGTSMATPHVCGVGALIMSSLNIVSPAAVKQKIIDLTTPIATPTLKFLHNPCP